MPTIPKNTIKERPVSAAVEDLVKSGNQKNPEEKFAVIFLVMRRLGNFPTSSLEQDEALRHQDPKVIGLIDEIVEKTKRSDTGYKMKLAQELLLRM